MKVEESAVIAWRRHLHRFPEVSGKEEKTAAFLAGELRKMGYIIQEKVFGHGLIGLLPGDKKKKTVALRCDMDALPIYEETNLSFRSNYDGVMHACGHDGHMAMILGAAKALAANKPQGSIKILCQPSEEKPPGGASGMIKSGVLENPYVDAVLGCHVSNHYSVGKIAVINGPMMAIADNFYITLKGRGGHGALPHRNIDAIQMAAEVIVSFQHIISRQLSTFMPAVLSFGTIHGGTAYNVMPDEVLLSGTVRCFDENVRDYVLTSMHKTLKGITSLWDGGYDLHYEYGYPVLQNAKEITDKIRAVGDKIKDLQVVEMAEPLMIAEDFSYYAKERPATFFLVGTGNAHCQKPWHNASFDLDEKGLPFGAAILAQVAYDIANEDRR